MKIKQKSRRDILRVARVRQPLKNKKRKKNRIPIYGVVNVLKLEF